MDRGDFFEEVHVFSEASDEAEGGGLGAEERLAAHGVGCDGGSFGDDGFAEQGAKGVDFGLEEGGLGFGEGEVGVAGGFEVPGFEDGGADAVGFEVFALVVGDLVNSDAADFGGWGAVDGAGLGGDPIGGGGDHAGRVGVDGFDEVGGGDFGGEFGGAGDHATGGVDAEEDLGDGGIGEGGGEPAGDLGGVGVANHAINGWEAACDDSSDGDHGGGCVAGGCREGVSVNVCLSVVWVIFFLLFFDVVHVLVVGANFEEAGEVVEAGGGGGPMFGSDECVFNGADGVHIF